MYNAIHKNMRHYSIQHIFSLLVLLIPLRSLLWYVELCWQWQTQMGCLNKFTCTFFFTNSLRSLNHVQCNLEEQPTCNTRVLLSKAFRERMHKFYCDAGLPCQHLKPFVTDFQHVLMFSYQIKFSHLSLFKETKQQVLSQKATTMLAEAMAPFGQNSSRQ